MRVSPFFCVAFLFVFLCVLSDAQSMRVADQYKLWHSDTPSAGVSYPALSLATGIGGGGLSVGLLHPSLYTDVASGLALDSNGNIYIAGLAYSPDFPLVNPLPIVPPAQGPYSPCPSSFVAKLSPDGKAILYSTFLSGCSSSAPAISADASGNVYVAGTVSAGYAIVQVGGGTTTSQTTNAFVMKLDSNGALQAALTIGGSGTNAVSSVALGLDGKLYIAGTTSSSDFPITAGTVQQTLSSGQDVFLLKMDTALLAGNQASAHTVLYSTYLGPGSFAVVAADAAGNAYVAASTTSTAWSATPGVFQPQCWDATREGCADIIALKVNPAGSQFLYTTYLGGSQTDMIGALAIDPSGDAYLTGTTDSFDFPTTPSAYVSAASVSQSSFAVELSADASHLIYGTLLPSDNQMTGTAIAVDANGDAWIGGWTNSGQLPVQNGIQQSLFNGICFSYTPSGSFPSGQAYCPQAGYIAELNPSGSALLWATYLGDGPVSSIVLDPSGNLLAAGSQLGITGAVASPSKNNSASVVKISPMGNSLTNISVENAAGFQPGLPASGGIAALYVDGISSNGTTVAPGLPLPTQLAGVSVSVNGIAAPILAVASLSNGKTQVNFQVPFEVASPQPYIVEVQYAGQSAFIVPQQAGPGIFLLPDGGGAIQHASDYSLVTVQNPVARGEILIIYASGLGAVSQPVPSGEAASEPDPIGPNACNQVTTNAGTVLYAGLAPGFPGLYQVNVQVSQYLPPGVTYINLQSQGCWDLIPPQNAYQGNAVAIYIPN